MGNLENAKLTLGGALKILVAAVALAGWTVSHYAWISAIDQRAALDRQEQKIAHEAISRRLECLEQSQEQSRKVSADLTRAVDKVSVLLEQYLKDGGRRAGS